jgi:hypothetical protein
MDKEIKLVFHNQGLRSYIEVDLCSQCPRQDGKGCCGYYSPVFYPTDLAYLYMNNPALVDYIFTLPDLTILDASVTVNNDKDGESYRCKFHSQEGGCILTQLERETICRHFVCPGINWQQEAALQHWDQFFTQLFDYEIDVNNRITTRLVANGLSLKNPSQRARFQDELLRLYQAELQDLPNFLTAYPRLETFSVQRPITWGNDWTL